MQTYYVESEEFRDFSDTDAQFHFETVCQRESQISRPALIARAYVCVCVFVCVCVSMCVCVCV